MREFEQYVLITVEKCCNDRLRQARVGNVEETKAIVGTSTTLGR
jgi:hypothetical protein